MKKKVNEELEMDMITYKKVKGTLDPKTPVKITGDKPDDTMLENTPEAVIEPQDKETIKYLSNVKDTKTGDVSKPFTINGKNYQMVRGITPSKEVVMAVYCHDDIDTNGENLIHDIKYFEENIANPAKAQVEQALPSTDDSKSVSEVDTEPKEKEPVINVSPKLGEYKHFFVDTKTGKVRKFKYADELAKANMTETEKYMNLKDFKKHVDETLFGIKTRKNDVSEDTTLPEKPDVKIAIEQMLLKVKPYITKLNEQIEKVQFIVELTKMIGLDSSKYQLLYNELKAAGENTFDSGKDSESTTTTSSTSVYESKKITKNELLESLGVKRPNKVIKVKDIK